MAHFLLILRLLAIISYWQASKAKDIVERETTSGEYLLQLINPGRNHATAETTCSDRSSWLVEIKTAALQVAFKSLLRGGAVWIGGKYRDGAWKWGDGTLVTYDGWASIHTKPASDGDCIDGRGNGWMSVDCSETRWLVCQRVKHWVVFFRSKQLEFFPDEEKTFYDAKEACRLWAAGGHLVHITSDKLDLRITQELTWRKASKLFYTSGNDILEDGVWKWGNDEPIDKNDKKWQTYRFYRDEPNGGDGENCLAKLKEGGRKWADISCNLENPYICEKDLVDDSCSAVDFCSNRGDCNVVSNKFVCRCGGYYRGRMCEIEPCQQITCRNGGVCHLTTNGPSCACKPEYQGKTCAELRYHKLEKEKCQYFISTFNKGDKTRASAFCERIGGSLTILSSSEAKNFVSTQILNLFASSSELKFWVGGSVTTDGIMQWADGSKLSSFTNDFGSCLEARIGGSHKSMKWFSSICGDVLGIICEKPTTGSPCDGINCNGHGTCKNIGCHYRCQCDAGYDGRNCDWIHRAPNITSWQADACAPVIKVKWRPLKDAVGITHRIQLQSSLHFDSQPDSVDVIPKNKVYEQEFGNLSYSTTYTIKILVCPDYCLKPFHSFRNVTTAPGPPGKVKEAITSQAGDGNCIVSWAKPKLAKRLTSYKITAESVLIYYSSKTMMNLAFKQENTTLPEVLEYTHRTMPNRNYSFRVQAETCSGPGISVLARGTCVTKRAAPSFIDPIKIPPNIAEDGTLQVILRSINENNGPISCVFLIVATNNVLSTKEKIHEEWLRDISVGPSQKLGSEYIAIALSKNELSSRRNTNGEIDLKIGDTSTTLCNVRKDTSHKRSKRAIAVFSEFSGRNDVLDKHKKYGFFVVSSTPREDGIVEYKSSKMSIIEDDSQSFSSWIIGVVIGVILLVVIVIGLISVLIRRRRPCEPVRSPNISQTIPMASTQNVPENDAQYEPVSHATSSEPNNTAIAYTYEKTEYEIHGRNLQGENLPEDGYERVDQLNPQLRHERDLITDGVYEDPAHYYEHVN